MAMSGGRVFAGLTTFSVKLGMFPKKPGRGNCIRVVVAGKFTGIPPVAQLLNSA